MNAIEAHIDSATVQAIAQLIVERFDPEQIILFGSHARGEVGAHSDVDLLIVLRTNAGRPQHGNPIYRTICQALHLYHFYIVSRHRFLCHSKTCYR